MSELVPSWISLDHLKMPAREFPRDGSSQETAVLRGRALELGVRFHSAAALAMF